MTIKKPALGLFREMPKPQTAFEKTAAAAKSITEIEATKRANITATLREARLARDSTPAPTSKNPLKT
ncbi:MAG TPA: hypothetical protein VGC40_13750 [Paenirhodobacter sp.]